MKNLTASAVVLAVLLAACATPTAITGSWKRPGYAGTHPQKVAVLSLAHDKVRQAVISEAMAKSLRTRGLAAESGLNILDEKDIPSGEQGRAQREHLNGLLADQGFDLVITARLMDISKDKYYVAGHMQPVPMAYPVGYYDTLGNYWYNQGGTGMIYDPGYWVSTSKVVMETNVYELPTGKLAWTGQSQTVDPATLDAFSKSYAPKLVAVLFKDGILK